MPIYEFAQAGISRLTETTFSVAGMHERRDLQRLLRENVEVIAPETLLIFEEFHDWEEFSRELTSAVLWLNNHDVDIRCVRLKPYSLDGRLLVDVQQIIPPPEAADYQVQIREKKVQERQARISNIDFTRYDIQIEGERHESQWKRNAIFLVCKHLCERGA